MSKEDSNCERNNCIKPCMRKSCMYNCIFPLVVFIIILFVSTLTFIYYICPPTEPEPFLSSYFEVLGNTQTVEQDSYIVFDVDSYDDVGNNITIDPSGTILTINQPGLYLIEWDVNLSDDSVPAVIGIIENGEGASGATTSSPGNFSSGTLIEVDTVPFTISLYNYGDEITLENPPQWEDSAASIRIVRFADGPSE